MTIRRTLVGAVAGLLVSAAPAFAARPPAPWATVNVCDTKAHPDGLGVRGSMPGLGTRRTHMYLRIQAQFQMGDGTWRDLDKSGDSGWLDAGKSTRARRQTGQTFTITPPAQGVSAYVLRARVTFEWRRGSKVLKRVSAFTTAAHHDAGGADPPGYSAAVCTIA